MISVVDFRKRLRAHAPRPHDDLNASPKNDIDHLRGQLQEILNNGWERWGHRLPGLKPPVPWHERHGSFDNSLHAWEPLELFLRFHDLTGDDDAFRFALDIASDWVEQNFPLHEWRASEVRPLISHALANRKDPVWYDMTTGQRIYRLAYILDVAARDERVEDGQIERLLLALRFHHELLAQEAFFKPSSNHGIYQALGQLSAARRFLWLEGFDHYHQLALQRVRQLMDAHFIPSGSHREHSPSYHYMVLGSFRGAASSGLFENAPDLLERLHAMEQVLAWMIKPNGRLLTIGDSDVRQLADTSSIAGRYDNPVLKYILSLGQQGTAPPPGIFACHDAGYAFARLYAPEVEPEFRNASYLAQIAGFHSRVHKHADHLSFVWFDGRREILTDPARFGYVGRTERGSKLAREGFYYSDPRRIYVESTRAHNCVEIDGRDYPRAGRHGKPFGSALKYAGEQDGMAVTSCEVTHFGSILHWRGLVMRPGHFLLVLDWLHERAMLGRHDYRQWFKFHPDWQVALGSDGIVDARHDGDEELPSLRVRATELTGEAAPGDILRGQEQPRMQGWYSDAAHSLIPAASFNMSVSRVRTARFATLFVLGENLRSNPARTRVNATMRKGRLAWEDDRGAHELSFERGDGHNGRLVVSLRTRP